MRLLITLALAWAAHAGPPASRGDFVNLSNGRSLWVEVDPPAPGHPWLVLPNGLTYTTRDYDAIVAVLRRLEPGLGVVRYDMRGMGQTMLRTKREYEDVTIEQQAEDLNLLVGHLGLEGRVVAAGLSYGAAVALTTAAAHPDTFAEVVAMAPLLGPLPDFTRIIEHLVSQHRLWQPFAWHDRRSRDELFDHYSRQMVFTTYPLAEPVVRQHWPYKLEHIARLVKGSKAWRASDLVARLPHARVHFVFAALDEYVPIAMSKAFASALPAGLVGSVLYVTNGKHKLTEAAPETMAKWILRIVNGDPALKRGLTYQLDVRKPAECETLILDRT